MSSYKISFDQIRQDHALSDMLKALERGLEKFNIDYYLVGAVSRDVWMSGINSIPPKRTTGDIDFAVFINDKGIYEQLKEYLIKNENFSPFKENAFVLIWKDGTEVDLLPFGAVEDEDRKVTVSGTGYTSVHVDGFKEVHDQELPEIDLEGLHRFKFCTLPGIVLLKLIAWDDRPEARRDDIKDISDILNHFFDMHQEMIWEDHNDLFEQEETNADGRSGLLLIAANVLGREIKKIAYRSDSLFDRIKKILADNSKDAATSKMAAIMTEYFDNTVENNLLLLKEIYKGLE